jgi:hypothetical protein
MLETAESLAELRGSDAWRNSLILYDPTRGRYGLPIALADEPMYEPIQFCPWCGRSLAFGVA